ncbi:MAG: hypothetical protein EOO88_33490 [Pedobacter sp.]|nr:MAG: hypothetical protein EOO88_33490 [Pedobacter sp.]
MLCISVQAPGSEVYAIGSPLVDRAVMQLENGKQFIVETVNQSKKNVYVQKVLLNGKPVDSLTLQYNDIASGGTLIFYLGAKPKK